MKIHLLSRAQAELWSLGVQAQLEFASKSKFEEAIVMVTVRLSARDNVYKHPSP